MNNTKTLAILAVLTAATLVIGVGIFAATTTQAKIESESSSTACVNDEPCKTTVSNPNTADSPNVNHNRIHMSTTCINDQPCKTTVSNSTQSQSQNGFGDNKD